MAAEVDAGELEPLRGAGGQDVLLVDGAARRTHDAAAEPAEEAPPARQGQHSTSGKSNNPKERKLGTLNLFDYATFHDKLILSVGVISSIIHGACLPCLALVFGEMTVTLLQQIHADNRLSLLSEVDNSNDTFLRSENKTDQAMWTEDLGDLKKTATISQFSIYFVYIGLGAFIAAFIQSVCWETTSDRLVYRMRRLFFAQLLRQDISWYDEMRSGELTSKISDDLERVREGIGIKFSLVLQNFAAFIVGFIVGFYANWRLTLVILGISPLLVLTSAFLSQATASSVAREQLKYAAAGGVAEEVLSNIRTVAAFGGQPRASLLYEKCLEQGRILATRRYFILSFGFGVVYALTYSTYGLVFWYGSQLVANGDASTGSVFTVFFGTMAGAFAFGGALPFLTAVTTAVGAASTVFEIIERIPGIDSYEKKGEKLDKVEACIAFQNVTFQYPTRPEIEVLKDFNMNIKPGQRVALVGSSGAGKSTVVALLLRFYDFTDGKIFLDGKDIRSLNIEWLRRQIGLVSQEPVLFGVSILDNIKYGYHNVSLKEVMHAAKLSNAHHFISSMPQGYDTLVGTSGAQLSGGQKQRIAIARALVRNPKILLLDEATSALDAQSEGEVQAALEQAMQGRTTIVIAHRLSTVRNADVIYVMKDGCVTEHGMHEELLLKQGDYHTLVQAQIFHSAREDNIYQDDEVIPVKEEERNNQSKTSVLRTAFSSSDGTEMKKKLNVESVSPDHFKWTMLFKLQAPEWKILLVGCIGCVVYGVTLPCLTYFYGEVFATFTLTGEEFHEAARFWSVMFCVVALAYGSSFAMTGAYLTKAAECFIKRVRLTAFQNILNQAVAWFDMDTSSPGSLITRLARDPPLVRSISGMRAGLISSAYITIIAALVIAFCHGWKLALLLLIGVPIIIGAAYQQAMILRAQRNDAKLMAEAGKIASESVQNIRTVQALGKESLFVKMYVETLGEPYRESKKQAYKFSLLFGISQTAIFFMYAASFSLGSYFIENGDMEPADVYKVFFALTYCAYSAGQTAAYFQDIGKAKMATSLMIQLIDRESDMSSEIGIKPIITGTVSFENVHFQYPCRPDVSVLRDFSITVEKGKTLAVVGSSGCGKSTVVSLLERFYDTTGGAVKVDGFDIRTLNLGYLRENIGLVTQEPTLFDCSIWENIAYGSISGDPGGYDVVKLMPEIIEAARAANIHEFICSLPEGYNTKIGEGGKQLSTGQKQRIAIARALIRDPKILVLDEATSALDTVNEKIVQDALDKAQQGRTCIVIAHRLSTIQNADNIAVIHQGRVAEQGSHEELMALKGRFYHLVQRQTSS